MRQSHGRTDSRELASHVDNHDDSHDEGADMRDTRSALEDDGVRKRDVSGEALCRNAMSACQSVLWAKQRAQREGDMVTYAAEISKSHLGCVCVILSLSRLWYAP